jgi:hypothetical protein
MDVWNPEDLTTKTLIAEMPMEIGHSNPHQHSRIITLKDNTELIFFGGWCDTEIKEVWKYKSQSDSWEVLGQMQIMRSKHLVVPVTGMDCP